MMKDTHVIILCGGRGTRMHEHSGDLIPKPMVRIGDRPILHHIANTFSRQGFKHISLALGHLGGQVKRYFRDIRLETALEYLIEYGPYSDRVTREFESAWFTRNVAGLKVWMHDTGPDASTAKRILTTLSNIEEASEWTREVFVTYGDGLADVDLEALLSFHIESGRVATVTGVSHPGRFGEFRVSDDGRATAFNEKPGGRINGGFMVLDSRRVRDYLMKTPDDESFEACTMPTLASNGELGVYQHDGFWQCMDTPSDREKLQLVWDRLGEFGVPWLRSRS